RSLGIATREQDNLMSEPDQFVGQPRNNALRASIKLGRNGLGQRGYLCNLHPIILFAYSSWPCRLRRQARACRACIQANDTCAAIAGTSSARQCETELGRGEKRKLSTRSAGLPPQAAVRDGRRLPSRSTRPRPPQISAARPPTRDQGCSVPAVE